VNLDYGSIARNDEINTLVLSLRFGGQMNDPFMHDLKNSEPIDATVWQQRSASERIDEAIARSLKPML
jgi:phosphatidylserine/phosphatidylglycerophosphate/cardiolipin synthase-like enzyme